MDGKNDELAKSKSDMETVGNDPHDSWDIDAFKATLKEEGTSGEDSEKKESDSNFKRAFVDVKEGGVVSYPAGKAVYGAARNALIAKQEADFEKLKAKAKGPSSEEISISDTDEPIVGSKSDRLPEDSKSAEWKGWETKNGSKELVKAEAITPEPEKVASKVSPEFEKAKAEWSAARANARKLEEEYKTKYIAHILEQSKGLKGLVNLPRRMLGFQPSLTDELLVLEGASLVARRTHKEAGKTLKEIKEKEGSIREDLVNPRKDAAKRYERMLAYHLVVGTQKRRLEAQQDAIGEAWDGSKFKPVMEALNKHKYARIGAMTLGYGVLAGLTGGLAAAAYGGGAYLTRIGVAMGLGAGVGMGGQAFYVGEARKRLAEAKKEIGDDFFQNDFMTDDQEMKELTFEVASRQAQVRTAAMLAGLSVGLHNIEAGAGGVSVEDTPSSTEPSTVESVTPPTPEVGIEESLDSSSASDASVSEEGYSSEKLTGEVDNFEKNSESNKLDNDVGTDSSVGRAGGDVSEPSRSSGSGVDRVDTNTEVAIEADNVVPEVTKDYSLPPFSSVGDLPSTGIIESIPQAPAESIPYIVEKGDNVWNIMEGKGPDANPIGGKSEVLQGMSPADREAALDKLVEYAEQNPEFAKEVGAVKSGGDIHRVYPGEEINVSMLDDKLRELLGISEATSEPDIIPEATVPTEELGTTEIQPEPVAEQVAEELVATPEPVPTPLQTESSPILDRVAYTPDDTGVGAQEATPAVMGNAEALAAVNNYVAGVEKATGGFLDSLIGISQPSISGTFDLIKGLNLNDMVGIAQSGQLPEGVSQVGWDRWVDHINDSIAKSPINAGETIGQYITRIASTRIA